MTETPKTAGPLGLDPQLLEILACPDTHHSPLTVDELLLARPLADQRRGS